MKEPLYSRDALRAVQRLDELIQEIQARLGNGSPSFKSQLIDLCDQGAMLGHLFTQRGEYKSLDYSLLVYKIAGVEALQEVVKEHYPSREIEIKVGETTTRIELGEDPEITLDNLLSGEILQRLRKGEIEARNKYGQLVTGAYVPSPEDSITIDLPGSEPGWNPPVVANKYGEVCDLREYATLRAFLLEHGLPTLWNSPLNAARNTMNNKLNEGKT